MACINNGDLIEESKVKQVIIRSFLLVVATNLQKHADHFPLRMIFNILT